MMYGEEMNRLCIHNFSKHFHYHVIIENVFGYITVVGHSLSNGTWYVCHAILPFEIHKKISDTLTETLISSSMILVSSNLGKDNIVIEVVNSFVHGKWINSYSFFPSQSIKSTNWRISSQTYTSDNVFAAGCVCKWFRQCIEYR